MRSNLLASALGIGLIACGSVSSNPDAPPGGDGPTGGDGPMPDAPASARCNPTADFGSPVLVPGINTSFDETGLSLTADERIAFVGRTNTSGPQTLKVATRASIDDDFGPATEDPRLAAINDVAGDEYNATVSGDGLILYFHRQSPAGGIGVLVSTRNAANGNFGNPRAVSVDGTTLSSALSPTLSADAQTLYWLDFSVFRLHSATRGSNEASFTDGRDASSIDNVYNVALSRDELTMYSSNGIGTDILSATRGDTSGSFGTGVPVNNVNSAQTDFPVYITRDNCILYFASTRPGGLGGTDIWMATRLGDP
jgi:hypothetical protein